MINGRLFLNKISNIHLLINIVISIEIMYSVSFFGLPENIISIIIPLVISIGFVFNFIPSIISIRAKTNTKIITSVLVYFGALLGCFLLSESIRIIAYSSNKNISDSNGFAILLGYYILVQYNVGVILSVILILVIKLVANMVAKFKV